MKVEGFLKELLISYIRDRNIKELGGVVYHILLSIIHSHETGLPKNF